MLCCVWVKRGLKYICQGSPRAAAASCYLISFLAVCQCILHHPWFSKQTTEYLIRLVFAFCIFDCYVLFKTSAIRSSRFAPFSLLSKWDWCSTHSCQDRYLLSGSYIVFRVSDKLVHSITSTAFHITVTHSVKLIHSVSITCNTCFCIPWLIL